jgi:hypothetical protein
MDARLLIRSKELTGQILIEIVVWLLPEPLAGSKHRFKYRLFCGLLDGTCLARYDNEKGKGDHRHIMDREHLYEFKDLQSLFRDFAKDVDDLLKGRTNHEEGL